MDDQAPINAEKNGAATPTDNSHEAQLFFPICAADVPPVPKIAEPVMDAAEPAVAIVQTADVIPQPADILPQPAESAKPEDEELLDWKEALRAQFEDWLQEVDQIPDSEPEEGDEKSPDLYSFYEQWVAANTEARRGNRRVAEAFSQWGQTLARFESDLHLLRDQIQRLPAAAPADTLSRTHCLTLVELLDRLQRVEQAFGRSPTGPWWKAVPRWRQAWESQRQAVGILMNHFEALLKKEGVTRIQSLGQPFDPSIMSAVAVEPGGSASRQTVLEELAPGYRRGGELLRPAEVKVSSKIS